MRRLKVNQNSRVETRGSGNPLAAAFTGWIQRSMRPIKLSAKNSLFAGSDEGADNWAAAASLIETCKLNGVNPQTYFTDLLTRLVNGWPQAQIDELMPWCWKPAAAN
jgi:hypothetical protein